MEHIYKIIIEGTMKGNIEKETAKLVLKELKANASDKKSDIAIIGMAVRYPSANNVYKYWNNIISKNDLIKDLPTERKNDVIDYMNFKGMNDQNIQFLQEAYIDEIDKFDYKYFNIIPKEANMMDPNQRLFMEVAMGALEDAGYSREAVQGTNTGVFLGYSNDLREAYAKLLLDSSNDSLEIAAAGNLSSVIPSRISYFLDLKGPSMVIGTSCSSSLVSVHVACNLIQNGECEMAIVGSSKLDLLPFEGQYKLGIEAEDGRTKAFDDRGDGTGFGEGVAAILLKPLDKAVKAGDNIYAVIKGSAINQDGKTAGITVPSVEAQTEVILKAWENAKVDPRTISYIEAHGTGTKLGDPIEIEGINNAFRKHTDLKQFCAIGTVKSNIGHLYEGAGLASLIKAAMALHQKQLPPSIYFEKPNSRIDFCNSAIYINDVAQKWKSKNGPRRCGVSSFGFSGTNCHMILEEYIKPNERERAANSPILLAVSAQSEEALLEILQRYLEDIEYYQSNLLEDVCYTSFIGRNHYDYRSAFLVHSFDELKSALEKAVSTKMQNVDHKKILYGICNVIKLGSRDQNKSGITLEQKKNYSDKAKAYIRQLENDSTGEVLKEIGNLYVNGADCDWKQLFKKNSCQRVSLPIYEFEKSRCWVEYDYSKAVTKSATSPNRKLFAKKEWVKKNIAENRNPTATNRLVFTDRAGNDSLVEELKKTGGLCKEIGFGEGYIQISKGNYLISNMEDYNSLLDIIEKEEITQVIYHRSSFNTTTNTLKQLEESLEQGVYSLFRLLSALAVAKKLGKLDIILLADEVYPVTGEETKYNSIDAAFFGFCRSAAKEYGNITCKCIDKDADTELRLILQEISAEKTSQPVAYRNNERYVEHITNFDISQLSEQPCSIREQGVYVITGGLGGLGLEIGKRLSKEANCNVIFINRTPLPDKASWRSIIEHKKNEKLYHQIQMIQEIEQAGTTVECFTADVSNLEQMTEVFHQIYQKYLQVNGVFHCAGVAGRGLIRNKQFTDFQEVLSAKMKGAWILDYLTKQEKLDFMILFSSEASLLALPGQSDYTAANCYLDSFAYQCKNQGCHTMSINWPSWKDVGMARDNGITEDTIFRQMTTQEGIDILFQLKNKKICNVIVGEWNYNKEMLHIADLSLSDEILTSMKYSKQVSKTGIINKLKNVILEGRVDQNYSKLESDIANIWGETLGFHKVNIYDSFYDLGGDSIQAMKLVKALSEHMKCTIGIGEILNYTTVADQAKYVEDNQLSGIAVKEESELDLLPMNTQVYECSAAQKRMYVIDKIEYKSTSYNLPQAYYIKGKLEQNKLEKCFDQLIQRHEILRTSFEVQKGEVVQRINDNISIKIILVETNLEILENQICECIQSFDLSKAPLMRVFLFSISEMEQVLLVDMHHIIVDGTSEAIMMQELVELYQGNMLLQKVSQYKEFAYWQNKLLKEERLNEQGKYWINKLSKEPPVLNLPTDFKRPQRKSYHGNEIEIVIDKEMSKQIKIYAANEESTLNMVMLAAYYVLLYRYTNQEDIIIGTPVSGRTNGMFDQAMGMFINTILMRNFPSGEKKFQLFLKELKANMLEALDNQEYPMDYLIKELNVKRDLSRNVFFDTMFSMLNMPSLTVSVEGLEIKEFPIKKNVSKFDLTMEVQEKSDEIIIGLEYCTDLFKEASMRRLLGNYEQILYEIISNREITLDAINLVAQEERELLTTKYNATQLDYNGNKSIGDLFEERVVISPDNIAVQFQDTMLTYEQLNKIANYYARLLVSENIQIGSRIAVVLNRTPKMLACILATLKIGAAYIPIDPTYPKDRIEYILDSSKTDIVITDNKMLEIETTEKRKVITLQDQMDQRYEDSNLAIEVDAETDAYIIYTSGSTGNPKGVRISHRAVHNFIQGVISRIDFNESKSILALTTISFDIFVLESLLPLSVGMKVVLANEKQIQDPNLLSRLIIDNNINMVQMTPSRAQLLLKYGNNKAVFEKTSELMIGGEAVPLQLVEDLRKLTKAKIYNMYGPTETTVWSTIGELTDKNHIDVGYPIANTQVYVVNQSKQLQPIGIPGELCIAGDGLSNGYLYRDDITYERFVQNPFQPNEKMYRTGDLAKWNIEGCLEILGRMDSQVKVRGFRVELGEIETWLLKYEGIKAAAATVKTRENESYIAAYYVAEEEIPADDIRNFLSKQLTDYMMPSYYCRLSALPYTPNGKIDRNNLPEIVDETAITKQLVKLSNYNNEIEREIAQLWSTVIERQNINIWDNFFDVGGTSISLIKLHSELEQKYPNTLTVTDLFEHTTIEKMAKAISNKLYGEAAATKEITKKLENSEGQDIAIIGVSSQLPGGMDTNLFWDKLKRGTDLIGEVPDNRKRDSIAYVNYANKKWNNIIEYDGFLKGAFLDEVENFDYGFFNISPREASLMDPNQRLLLQTIYHAIEDAGYGDESLRGTSTGVYIGHSADFGMSYRRMLEADENSLDGISVPGNIQSVLAGRIAYLMDFQGPSMVIDTACSSSLVAVALACKDIQSGKCTHAIVGGSNIILLPLSTQQKMGIEASDGHAKTFDDRSDGTGLGEGVIAILLKPLQMAIQDKDNIYAVIKGSAINQDGSSIGLTAPNAKAQERVILQACEDAGISGDSIGYIEAHGTGTKLGDPIEIQGITKALSKFTDKKQFCAIGALKTNLGHLDSCAGLAGLLKTILILKNKEIPPTLHFNLPNHKINFEESPVYINDICRKWENDNMPRRCMVNAFGLSGTNCSVIMEEAPNLITEDNEPSLELFTLSAKTETAFFSLVESYLKFLKNDTKALLKDICYTANVGRKDHKYRTAFIVKSNEELITALENTLQKGSICHNLGEVIQNDK